LSKPLSGVIAAIATPIDETGAPDLERAVNLARYCWTMVRRLNVLGTTGEATSFSVDERKGVMDAYKSNGLPMHRLMVGTGAASVTDAVALSRHAADLGFGGALVLPPFYYKGVPDDGLVAYVETLVKATEQKPIPIYLYHFPAMSGLPWHVALIRRLLESFSRIAGLKDPPATWPTPARLRPSRGILRYSLQPKPACSRRAAAILPGASPRPPISCGPLRAGLGQGRYDCGRWLSPYASLRRQAIGPGREGAARTYTWRARLSG
jgi:dihydrodipicolinate synthase/N-acetylneuraminate lyase